MAKMAGRSMKSVLALLVALGALLATPGAGHAQGDPASVARALIDAENRHDVEAAVALFTPDAVVIHATGTLKTTAEIRNRRSAPVRPIARTLRVVQRDATD